MMEYDDCLDGKYMRFDRITGVEQESLVWKGKMAADHINYVVTAILRVAPSWQHLATYGW
jgi:hypothetical protein